MKEKCKVITDKGFLLLTMPDGTVIPFQTNMILKNDYKNEGISEITITVIADTKFIKNRIQFENVEK